MSIILSLVLCSKLSCVGSSLHRVHGIDLGLLKSADIELYRQENIPVVGHKDQVVFPLNNDYDAVCIYVCVCVCQECSSEKDVMYF